MLEYLHASVAIESPVGLPNKASFVKFESSGTLISNLTKSPLVFHAISRSAVAESPCLPCEALWRSMGLRGDNSYLSCLRLRPCGSA